MATIKTHIEELKGIIEKTHQTPEEKLKRVENELKVFESERIKSTIDGEYIITEKEKLLREYREILKEQVEQEKDKKELQKIKYNKALDRNIKDEIKELLFNEINEYFIPKEHDKRVVYETLCEYENIGEITKDITKIYGKEFEDYVLSIYQKTLNQVYNIYKPYIKLKEQEDKLRTK